MATHPNGEWPIDDLAVIPGGTKMGGDARIRRELLPSIVEMQAACRAETGLVLQPTSAADGYRDKPTQHRTFMDRYRLQATGWGPFSDVRWYDHDGTGIKSRFVRWSPKGSAAVPGTSNHGDAEAVDWADMWGVRLAWFNRRGPDFGWGWPSWASDNNPRNGSFEPWHREPLAAAFAVHDWNDMTGQAPAPTVPGDLPDPLTPLIPTLEDDDMLTRIRITDGDKKDAIYLVEIGARHRFIRLNPGASAGLDALDVPLKDVTHAEALKARTVVVALADNANLDRIDFDLV